MRKNQQLGRGPWKTRGARGLSLLAAALVVGAVPAAGQSVETRLDLDGSRLDRLLAASNTRNDDLREVALADILEEALTISYESDQPHALVLFAFAIKEGRIVARFESKAVIFRVGQETFPTEDYLPDDRFYGALEIDRRQSPGAGGGTGKVNLEDMIGPGGAVPAERAVRDPAGIASRLYPGADWKEHVAVFLVAVPEAAEVREGTAAYPSPLFIPAMDGSSK